MKSLFCKGIFLILFLMLGNNYPENSLRHTFNEVALLYDEIRPRYPDELFLL